MILGPNGQPVRKTTETTLSPRLVEMLSHLDDILAQTGLTLRCFKCEALGLDARVKGDNSPESDVYRVSCSCSTRTYHKKTGKAKVFVN